MPKLIKHLYDDHYIHFGENVFFDHGMWGSDFENQNPNDFGFLYYVKNGSKTLVGSCIYEFDYLSEFDSSNDSIKYLCDFLGNQYKYGYEGTGFGYSASYKEYGSYYLMDSEKLIHENDYQYISVDPFSNNSRNWLDNNSGNWVGAQDSSAYGGGVYLSYKPSSPYHDNIYVYLTNGPLRTNHFTMYDMTDDLVLAGYSSSRAASDSKALMNNILHAYDMGDCYNYRNNSGYVTIQIIFNNIGMNSTSGEYSIFYGLNTWIYIYSSSGKFHGKKANVQKYNSYNRDEPIQSTHTFSQYNTDDNIGYDVIGFPIIEYYSGGAWVTNYYNISIS